MFHDLKKAVSGTIAPCAVSLLRGLGVSAQETSRGLAELPDAEPEGLLTLRDAVALTLRQNPELAVFGWDIRAAKAQVELSAARIEEARIIRELEALRFSLAAMWGSRTPSFTAVVGNLEEIQPVPPYGQPQARIARGLDVGCWTTEVEQREAAVTLERTNRAPDLEATLGFRATCVDDVQSRTFGSGGSFLGSSRTRFDRNRRLQDTPEKKHTGQFYTSIPKAVIVDGRVGICCIRF